MEKNKEIFDLWNEKKKEVDLKWKIKRVKVWEIWLCKIGINIWWEISKDWKFLRPVLITSNKLWLDLVWVIPLTSVYNEFNSNYLLELDYYERYWLDKKSYLVLNQFKIISLKRFTRKLNGYYRLNTFLPLVPVNKIKYYLNKYFSIIK